MDNIHADVIPLRDEGVLSLLFFQCSLGSIQKKKKIFESIFFLLFFSFFYSFIKHGDDWVVDYTYSPIVIMSKNG